LLLIIFVISATATSKPHVINPGKPTPVRLLLGPSEEQSASITVRAFYLGTKLKEYTADRYMTSQTVCS
jgi:hypothetical protein